MKRRVVGVLLWLAVVGIIAVITLRWPVLFWLLVLSVCLYLIFGRKGELELRLGVGTRQLQKRLYAAVIWQRRTKPSVEPGVEEPAGIGRVKSWLGLQIPGPRHLASCSELVGNGWLHIQHRVTQLGRAPRRRRSTA